MIGKIYQVGPQHLVSSLIILFCGGQIAAASVGIAVEKQKRCLCLLPNINGDPAHGLIGNTAETALVDKKILNLYVSILLLYAFIQKALHLLQPHPPVNFAFPLRLLCNFLCSFHVRHISRKPAEGRSDFHALQGHQHQ